MTRGADLLEQALTIYQREGQSGVEHWAEQPGIAPHTEILFCDACEDDEPHINDICAVCWTARRPAKAALKSNADAQPVACRSQSEQSTVTTRRAGRGAGGHQRFWLDAGRLAAYVISNEEEPFGFDSSDERGFAAAIASRFDDAHEAGAIGGPSDLEVIVYALAAESLIVAVRERELPSHLKKSLRQLATFSFDATDVACFGDDRFEECCAGIAALLERANQLLPSFALLCEAE
jgi:hypothetical protein